MQNAYSNSKIPSLHIFTCITLVTTEHTEYFTECLSVYNIVYQYIHTYVTIHTALQRSDYVAATTQHAVTLQNTTAAPLPKYSSVTQTSAHLTSHDNPVRDYAHLTYTISGQ